MKLSRKDEAALKRCLKQIEADAMWAENFRRRRAGGDDELTLMLSACSILQHRNLRLSPWEVAPCDSDPCDGDDRFPEYAQRKAEARVFADEMRRAKLSIYEPDPKAALTAAAEARQRALHVVSEPPNAA